MYPNKEYTSDLSTILNQNILSKIKQIIINEKY